MSQAPTSARLPEFTDKALQRAGRQPPHARGSGRMGLVDHFERWAKVFLYRPRNGQGHLNVSVTAINDVDVPSGADVQDHLWRYRDLFHRRTFRMLANCGENIRSQFLTRNRNLAHRHYYRCCVRTIRHHANTSATMTMIRKSRLSTNWWPMCLDTSHGC